MALMADFGNAVATQSRHEVAQDMHVAKAAVAGEHHLEEHVLREQQSVAEARRHQPRDRIGSLIVRRALHLLIGIEVVHADHVVFDECPAGGAGSLVIRVGEGRVHVAEHGVAGIAALLLDDVEHGGAQTKPAWQMDHQRQPGARLGTHRTAQRLLLLRREVRRHSDLANQADAHTVNAVDRLGHEFVGDGFDRHPRQ